MASVKDVLTTFLDQVKKNGFKGIRFEEIDRGGQEWTDDRGYFILYAEMMDMFDIPDSPYRTIETNYGELWRGVRQHLAELLPEHEVVAYGEDRHKPDCEFEIYRKKESK